MTVIPSSSTTNTPVPLPSIFDKHRSLLSKALKESLDNHSIDVYHMLRYYMGWDGIDGTAISATEGKSLRPALCLLGCQASGGYVTNAIPAAVSLELIHNFSLIHDDIQDGDRTRRNRPTLWVEWGIPKALVAGNVLRIIADIYVQKLRSHQGIDTERCLKTIGLLTEAYLEMIEGQFLDISYEGRSDVTVEQYMTMISKKTGALIRCALHIGSLIGTQNNDTALAFRECGRHLGYVFQIRDDFLGIWGDEKTTGKPVGADIRRRKNSFPVVYAMSCSSRKDRNRLTEVYRKTTLTDEDVVLVFDIMESSNVRGKSMSIATEHSEMAMEAITTIEIAPAIRKELYELSRFLLVREH